MSTAADPLAPGSSSSKPETSAEAPHPLTNREDSRAIEKQLRRVSCSIKGEPPPIEDDSGWDDTPTDAHDDEHKEEHGHGHGGHGHGHAEAGIVSCVISGLVCGVLMFVFASVFAEMMFGSSPALVSAVPLGVGMQTCTIMVGAIIFSYNSGLKGVVAGPDINPIVFLTEAALAVVDSVCAGGSSGSGSGSGSGASGSGAAGRMLAPSGSAPFECGNMDAAIPTVLVASAIATLMVGVSFYCLGRFKLTDVIGYIPANVVGGFLACIGIKVLKAAIQVACPVGKKVKLEYLEYYFSSWTESWMFIVPAVPIGCILYYLKRNHIGNPAMYFPFFIVVPTVVFFTIMFAKGMTMDDMREIGWLFPTAEQNNFWSQFTEMYGGLADGRVEWAAIPAALPSWIVMLLIVNLDNMLKLASTESSLAIDFDYNHEMKVGGLATLTTALLVGSPAYSQTKFNVLNFGMTHSTTNRIPALTVAAFNGALFFSGFPLINYLPRFVLSALLVFSSVGFLIENLWDARKKFNKSNFASIWGIFIVNVIASETHPSQALLIAIIVGVLWGIIGFAVHFTHKSGGMSASKSAVISGEDTCSSAIRSSAQEAKLGILGVWYHIMQASGYIFFGTAARLHRIMTQHVAEMKLRPRAERTKMVIYNLEDVFGLDASAGLIFVKSKRLAAGNGISIVWAGLKPSVERALRRSGVVNNDSKIFSSLDDAQKYVEDTLLVHVHKLSSRWLVDRQCRDIYNRAMVQDALAANKAKSDGIAPTQLLKWSARNNVPAGDIILAEGKADDGLYLLYKGKVQVREGLNQEAHTIYPGSFFNEHVLYSAPMTGALYTATAEEDCVMLRLSHEQRTLMVQLVPHHAFQLTISVFKQVEMRNPARRRHTWNDANENAIVDPITFNEKAEIVGGLPEDAVTLQIGETPTTEELVEGKKGWGAVKSAVGTASAASAFAKSGSDLEAGAAGAAASKPNRRGSCVGSLMVGALNTAPPEAAPPLQSKGSRRRGSCVGQLAAAQASQRDATMMAQLKTVAAHTAENEAEAAKNASPGRRKSVSGLVGGIISGEKDANGRRKSVTAQIGDFLSGGNHGSHGEGRRKSVTAQIGDFLTGHHEDDGHGGGGRRKSITSAIGAAIWGTTATTADEAAQEAIEKEGLLSRVGPVGHDKFLRHTEVVDQQFLKESDYKVPLTEAMVEHYTLIFELNDVDGNGRLSVDEMTDFMDSLGFPVMHEDLQSMIKDNKIEEAADGTIDLDGFLEFMRKTILSDLPSAKLPTIHHLFKSEVKRAQLDRKAEEQMAEMRFSSADSGRPSREDMGSPEGRRAARASREQTVSRRKARASKENMMASKEKEQDDPDMAMLNKEHVGRLFQMLGFVLDELTVKEVFDGVDSNGDGYITEVEFITCVGMLKRNLVEVQQLQSSFTAFRESAKKKAEEASKKAAEDLAHARKHHKHGLPMASRPDDPDDHNVYAEDLVAALGVSEEEAEEMIFIADLKESQAIDFTEFKQVVVNWSG